MKYILTILSIVLLFNVSFAQQLRDPTFPNYSIFSRDRSVGGTPTTQQYTSPSRNIVQPTVPVFNGSVKDDVGFTAVLQDGNNIIYLKKGDLIRWNNATVVNITLDTLVMSNNQTIKIGNDLLNQTGPQLPLAGSP